MPIIITENVRKIFFNPRTKNILNALEGINLELNEGEFLCVVGPSGCGKTTFLRLVAGLEGLTEGKLLMEGKSIQGPSWERGLIFQDHVLFPWRNVIKNVEFGLEARGIKKEERVLRAKQFIDLVGLSGFESAYPSELSGGMQQRVGLARVLANDSKVLLMDEPFGSVDAQTREVLQNELLKIWQVNKKTIFFVTHEIEESVYLADRIAVMTSRPGKIKEIITVDINRPREKDSNKFLDLVKYIKGLIMH
jgi:NitT/TauT family transport system ATP-binding protein